MFAVPHLHDAQVCQDRDVPRDRLEVEVIEELGMVEEDPHGAHADRHARLLGGLRELPVRPESALRASGHARDEHGEANARAKELEGWIQVHPAKLRQRVVHEVHTVEQGCSALNLVARGFRADLEMLRLALPDALGLTRVRTHGTRPRGCS